MTAKEISILIVDSSSTDRNTLKRILQEQADMVLVGEAGDGAEALELAQKLQPNLIITSLDLPKVSGLALINTLMHLKGVPILVLSCDANKTLTYQALEEGALEVMPKPVYGTAQAEDLVAKVRLLAGVSVITRMKSYNQISMSHHLASVMALTQPKSLSGPVFAIACSTGGPKALANLLNVLPADFPAPILIAQHISDGFVEGMAHWLDGLSKMPVKVAANGEDLRPSQVYISPSDQHLTLNAEHKIQLIPRASTDIYRPSCDAMLTSVAHTCGSLAVGIILTGMGRDGTKGMKAIYENGGITLAQDEASSVIYGMNAEAVAAGVIQVELPLASLAEEMLKILLLKPSGYLAALHRGEL